MGKCWLSEQAYEGVGQTQFLDSYLSVYVYVYVYQWYTISWYKTYKGKCWLSEQVYEWVGRTQWDFLQSWGMTADRIKEWPRNERKVRKSQAKPNLILKSISKTNPCVSNQRESCFSRILKIFCKMLPLDLEVFQFHFSFSILRNFHFTFPFSKNEIWWKPLASNCK